MSLAAITLPHVDPAAFRLGPFAPGWYAIAYAAAIAGIWTTARALLRRDELWGATPHPSPAGVEGLMAWGFAGSLIGGRFGYVLMRPEHFLAHPEQIAAIWQGGSSLHFAGIGGCIATWLYARRHGWFSLTLADVCAPGVALGIFFGRLANFVRAEHPGRPSEVPWAVVFPGETVARHPSQLYEAGLEGLAVFALLWWAAERGGLKRPGLLAGLFGVGHGVARVVCELFRVPGPESAGLPFGITMGMILTLPMIVAGLLAIRYALRRPLAGAA
ncbi:MAG: prolipoprotein diacylglyceryl transferase [Hyphomicrobiales bacterium]